MCEWRRFKFSFIDFIHTHIIYRCVAYGVLPEEEAEKLNKKVSLQKKKMRGGVASPAPAAKKKKKAKIMKEEDDDMDMQASGAERVGSAVI